MSELSRDTVIRFLSGRGGRVPNQQLVEHFRPLLTEQPPGEARNAARQLFKDIVNEVASVRAEDGLKYVCLRKRYRRAVEEAKHGAEGKPSLEPGAETQPAAGEAITPDSSTEEAIIAEPGTEKPITQVSGSGEAIIAEPGTEEPITPESGTEETSGEDAEGPSVPCERSSSDSSPGEESPLAESSPGYDGPPRISVTAEPQDEPNGEKFPKKPPSGSPEPGQLSARTPRNSRRGAARDPVSPQPRRGPGGVLLRPGLRDSDSSSLYSSSSVSGNEEEEAGGGSLSLEPLEHAWMLSSCRARWDGLQELLLAEPGLITRRDFITGFSCLHWAAKHGQHELLAALLTHARQHRVPVNINGRASGGYTPLHLAAMHGHLDVIKLLVGAYDADLDIRDYSGRKAWQYLSPDTARDVQALVGALPGPEEEDDGTSSGSGRWRLSKVLPSQLIVHRLSQLPEDEQDGWGRTRADISRKGSGGSRGKPRLNRIRFRTQIIHTNLSARDPDDEDDRALKSPIRLRPKSNVFG
ncbi:ankyrin repeat domain-containing protein SOWAHC [Mantella aurantiaca]